MGLQPPLGKEGNPDPHFGAGSFDPFRPASTALVLTSWPLQDNAGKTTLLYRLKVRPFPPPVGKRGDI